MNISAIVVAGGEGIRMGGPKLFIKIGNLPMVIRTCKVFERTPQILEVILVVPKNAVNRAKAEVRSYSLKKVRRVVAGGPDRQASVYNGLKEISPDCEYVLIHDGARPLILEQMISGLISKVKGFDGVILAVPISDTVKEARKGSIVRTLNRDSLWAVQTPQAFRASILKEAHEVSKKNGYKATDDSSLVERLGFKVRIRTGSYENIKITTPVDVKIAESILTDRQRRRQT
jgi:2-C-methyl-D-erythritol 4-phosphate cytidylyltransferase